jgi:hypothetical protein
MIYFSTRDEAYECMHTRFNFFFGFFYGIIDLFIKIQFYQWNGLAVTKSEKMLKKLNKKNLDKANI